MKTTNELTTKQDPSPIKVSESETFAMGYDYDNGYKYGKDYTYSDGTTVREIFANDGVTIDTVTF
jgi:hypothetical protein